MKKVLSIILVLVTLGAVCSSFWGCALFASTRVFNCHELSLTLEREYFKVDVSSKGYDAAYGSTENDLLIYLKRESFLSLEDAVITEENTTLDYAKHVLSMYDEYAPTFDDSDPERPFLSYSKPVDGEQNEYVIYFLRSEDAFWRIQFVGPSEKWESLSVYSLEVLESITFNYEN